MINKLFKHSSKIVLASVVVLLFSILATSFPQKASAIEYCDAVGAPDIRIDVAGQSFTENGSITVDYGTELVFRVYTYGEPDSQNSLNYPYGRSNAYNAPDGGGREYQATRPIDSNTSIFVFIRQNCSGDFESAPTKRVTVDINLSAVCEIPGSVNYGGSLPCILPMSGSISAGDCYIAQGGNSCTATVSWSTTNPQGTSAVTASGMANVNGNSGGQAMTVPAGGRTFYLYNNGTLLDQASSSSTCTSGTTWDGSTCAGPGNPPPDPMSGSISAGTCYIAEGGNSCSTAVSWSTSNPESTSVVTASGMENVNGNSGVQSMVVPAGGRTFFLYNNGALLAQADGVSLCTSGTTWNGSTCAGVPVPTPTASISASPASVAYGGSSTVSWSSTNADYCTSSWVGGSLATSGSINTGALYTNTGYAITCYGSETSASSTTVVSVGSAMSGDISANPNPCYILNGNNSCNTTLTWDTTNPQGTSAVTSSCVDTFTGNSGSEVVTVPAGGCIYYLYNNAVLLDQVTVQSLCVVGTVWNGISCVGDDQLINGVCSDTHYSCDVGESANNVNGDTNYTWSCLGSNGGSTASCSQDKPGPRCSAAHYGCDVGTSTNNVNGANAYTWSCLGSNGSSSVSCSEAKTGPRCSTTHYSCTSGTSTNNVNGANAYTWSCVGANNTGTISCNESKVPIVIVPPIVDPGDTITISWSCTGPSVGVNFDTQGVPSGSVTLIPAASTTYSVSCDSVVHSAKVVVRKKPIIIEQ